MDFKIGTFKGLSYEEYAAIPAYRSHDLMAADRCVFSWKNEAPMKETPALIEGRLQHTVFLEFDKFDEEFVIEPNVDRRTKAGKEEYEDFKNSLNGRSPVKQDMYDVCMERREIVKDFIPDPEDHVEWTVCFMWHGQQFKCRLDWYCTAFQFVWDLKTCRDASPRGFKSAVNNFKYFQQAALYVDAMEYSGIPCNGFKFLAQEKAHPYPYAVYQLSDEALEYGRAKNEKALKNILDCKASIESLPFGLEGVHLIGLKDLY